ncbi:MAG: DUF1697 domain-containing protein [Flavobacteriaceae bacterium]|nr:DUF1697 domain-containing protein [Bacteroidia bacterium]MBT8287957.1 DUF1697 domain-containing protein [Bacteroidia bacterium]NNF74440.1 DUF1697 domain-containing protein [Flavobacteriaceae bacterium]NNK73641.1 DUF1697 domain-containing protein [Flavobacteriaceae bacterium]
MKTFIALLRGINVGGHKKVPMAELREILAARGLQHVQTYIQSGNVVFQSEKSTVQLESDIHEAIKEHFRFDVPVLVRTHQNLKDILDNCPFEKEKKEKSYFTLLQSPPEASRMAEVAMLEYPGEEFVVTPECIYYFSAVGFGKAKFNWKGVERKLNVSMTARNFRTVQKLLSLSDQNNPND